MGFLSWKAKKVLILVCFVAELLLILGGIVMILTGNSLLDWAKMSFEKPDFEAIWAGIVLISSGIFDILVAFSVLGLAVLKQISKIKE
jgi:hypothetical protein